MDIFSNPTKVHGRVLWANPFTISHFSHKSHWYWDVGRPEWVSGSIPTTAPWSRTGWPVGLHTGYQNIRLIPEGNISHNRNILNLLHRIPFTDRSLSFCVLINPHTQSRLWIQSHNIPVRFYMYMVFILLIPITITAYFTLQWVQNISLIHFTDSLIQLLYWWSLANSPRCVIQIIRTILSFTWTISHLIYFNTSSYIKTPTLD